MCRRARGSAALCGPPTSSALKVKEGQPHTLVPLSPIASSRNSSAVDNLQPTHIGPQDIRHDDRPVGLLVVLHHRDQCAANRDA